MFTVSDNFDRGLPPDSPRGPNCGITAISVLTGVPFKDAWQYYNIISASDPTKKGETKFNQTCQTIQELGVKLEVVPYCINSLGMKQHSWAKHSVMKFIKEKAEEGVTYFIKTAHHVFVAKDGLVIDQSSNKVPVDRYWHRKGHVFRVMKVVEV